MYSVRLDMSGSFDNGLPFHRCVYFNMSSFLFYSGMHGCANERGSGCLILTVMAKSLRPANFNEEIYYKASNIRKENFIYDV